MCKCYVFLINVHFFLIFFQSLTSLEGSVDLSQHKLSIYKLVLEIFKNLKKLYIRDVFSLVSIKVYIFFKDLNFFLKIFNFIYYFNFALLVRTTKLVRSYEIKLIKMWNNVTLCCKWFWKASYNFNTNFELFKTFYFICLSSIAFSLFV